MLCQISGVFRTPDGEVLASTDVTFVRAAPVHAYIAETGPTVVVPNEVILTTDEDGAGTIGLYPGRYRVHVPQGVGHLAHQFTVDVPEEEEMTFTALLVQAPEYEHGLQPDAVQIYAAQAAAARDEAQGIVDSLGTLAADVQADANAVAESHAAVVVLAGSASTASSTAVAAAEAAQGSVVITTNQAAIASGHASSASTSATDAAASALAAQEAEDAVVGVAGNLVSVGSILFFAADTPPLGWLICDGTPVTALYADLRDMLIAAGSPYGTSGSDPLLPDLRGEFIRGWDGIRGVDAGRVFGSAQSDLVGPHTHTTNLYHNSGGSATSPNGHQIAFAQVGGSGQGDEQVVAIDSQNNSGAETRPRNVALLPCIKAFGSISIVGMADLAELLSTIASNAEAVAGLNNTKVMTPQRTKEAIAAQVKQGRRLLARRVLSNSPYVDFTEFNSSIYFWYDFELRLVRPVVDASKLYMLFSSNGGTSYANTASSYYQSGYYMEDTTGPANDGGSLAAVMLSSNGRTVGNAAGELGVRGRIEMRGAESALSYTEVGGKLTHESSSGKYISHSFNAKRLVAEITNAVRFIQSTGNLASGEILMFGHTE